MCSSVLNSPSINVGIMYSSYTHHILITTQNKIDYCTSCIYMYMYSADYYRHQVYMQLVLLLKLIHIVL